MGLLILQNLRNDIIGFVGHLERKLVLPYRRTITPLHIVVAAGHLAEGFTPQVITNQTPFWITTLVANWFIHVPPPPHLPVWWYGCISTGLPRDSVARNNCYGWTGWWFSHQAGRTRYTWVLVLASYGPPQGKLPRDAAVAFYVPVRVCGVSPLPVSDDSLTLQPTGH